MLLLRKLGASVILIAPPTLIPVGAESWGATISYSFDDVIENLDVVMTLRIQHERMSNFFFPSLQEYSRGYGLDDSRLSRMKASAVIMHPGPMNRGVEISSSAADSNQSLVLRQVTNGVFVRMAVLYHLLGGPQSATQ